MNIPSDLKISNQALFRCVTVMKLGLIPMEIVIGLYVLTRYFQVSECGRCKHESKNHSGAHYLSLPDPIVSTSCCPSLYTKQRINPKISNLTSYWIR